MGTQYPELESSHIKFIEQQKIFFVATAPLDGHINLSPKGIDSFRVVSPTRAIWLNLTGSGNETAAHLWDDPRMTIMFNAFEGEPMILRLYGKARAIHSYNEKEWHQKIRLFDRYTAGARQLIELDIELVHTSCGFGVPLYEYQGEREKLTRWIEKKGEDGIRKYWQDKNRISLNGKPTGIFTDPGLEPD